MELSWCQDCQLKPDREPAHLFLQPFSMHNACLRSLRAITPSWACLVAAASACPADAVQVTEQFLRTMHLIVDTSELTSPRMLGKVLRYLISAPFVKLWPGLQPGTGNTNTQAGSKSTGQLSA